MLRNLPLFLILLYGRSTRCRPVEEEENKVLAIGERFCPSSRESRASSSFRLPSHTQSFIMNNYWIYVSEALVPSTPGSWHGDGA
jgi:hypothetical protein